MLSNLEINVKIGVDSIRTDTNMISFLSIFLVVFVITRSRSSHRKFSIEKNANYCLI